MADEFKIVASLNIEKSTGVIKEDIKKLQDQIKNEKVKIVAGLDIGKSKSLIQSQLNTLANQAKAPTVKIGVDTSGLQNAQKPINDVLNVQRNLKTQSNDVTNQVIANERKKQEAYKATAESVVYHAGVISKYNKAETNGRFYGSSRGTGYFGTGHYFVDSAHKSEIMSEPFVSKPFTSVDISKYDNLFKANTNEIADALHSFLQRLTQYTQGLNSVDVPSLFEEFKKVFTSATMNIQEFDKKVSQLKAYMSSSSLNDRNDSVSTQFMKSLGYGGVDTRGTKYADTRYGTVIYDLKEESVLQANITNELQKQGQMLEQISYKTGEVFDKETDRLLQSKVQQSKLNSEIQAEYQKSFDNTNLKNAEAEYKNAEQSLTKINELIGYYENNIRNTTTEVQKLAQEMKSLGLEMTPDEIKDEEKRLLAESKQNLEEKIKEKQTIEQTIPVLKDKYEQELALSQQAYEKAKQVVEERHKETTAIEQQAQATERLKATQTQAQQIANTVSNVSNTSSLLETFKSSLANMHLPSDQIDSIASRISNLNVEITSLNQSMSVNKLGNRMLSVDISGTDKLGNAVKLTQKYNLETNELVRTIDTLSSATQKSSSQLDNLMAQQIKRKTDLKNQVEQMYKSAIDPNASRSITNGQNLDTLKAKYDEIKLAIDGMDGKSKTAFAQQEADISKLISNLKVVINQYKNAENVSTTLKPDKLASAISKAESQFQVLNTNIQNAGVSSDKLTQNIQTISSVLGKTQNGGVINKAEIEQVFTALSNARNELEALIKMKTSDSAIERVRIQAETLVSSLNTFANNNVGFDKFTTTVNGAVVSVDSLKQSLATVNSQSDLSIIRSQITALETAFKETAVDSDKYVTQINSAITKLQGIANSAVFTKNASNPQVTQTKQDINSLITAYQNLMTKLQGNITPAGLETVRTELAQLNARFNTATATAKQFESELKNDNGAEKLAQRVALLKAQLEALEKANPKAMKRFGSEINSLMATLNNSPDARAVDQVAKSVQLLRREINNADLAGKTFFQNLKEKAVKFTGWMSMTYAISTFTRYVREAVVELKEIDTILTEISKTSDRTEASLRRLGETSFATASKYGQKASDYLLGVQEMSRAGFGEKESEQMAELSTLAQSAGDMTAELANEYLIATNAGYQFGGSAEKLNAVLNSQNYITNRNALNMSELAEATKIVASQASQSGIGIDKMTAAVGTMIATTQQGGEVAARAFKGILMNLQQVKGTAEDIGDGGEDITTESLTKYEKACVDLGVSLKEVKDGVVQLRDPMVILEELANAVSKEAEGSVKVANLISSVGGKFCLVA